LTPVIIRAWFALAFGVMTVIDHTIHGAKAQHEVRSLAVAVLLVGLAFALRAADRRRKPDQSSGADTSSAR
jgi:hypothetical protein